MAYAAQVFKMWLVFRAGIKRFVVVDGKEGEQYDDIFEGSLIFSPDSKHVAYVAGISDKQFVVVDGKEERKYDGIGIPLIFSPDNNRVAYVAGVGNNKHLVVMDGKEGEQYDDILEGSLIFSPDSKCVAYVAGVDDKQLVVIDGKKGNQYDEIFIWSGGNIIGKIIFDSHDTFHYIARKGSGIYLVEERID